MPLKLSFLKSRLKPKIILRIFYGLLVCVTILLSYFRVFDIFEDVLLDFRFRLRPLQPFSDKIVIIEVSDDSLNQLGYWPLPRDFHASLVDVLSYAGARQVFFDFVFVEKTEKDEILAESIKKAGNVYLPYVVRLNEVKKENGLWRSLGTVAPIVPTLRDVVKGSGHINSIKDADGKVRKTPLIIEQDDGLSFHAALRMACDYLHIPLKNVTLRGNSLRINDELNLPVSPSGTLLVNFVGPWEKSFCHYSYVQVLDAFRKTLLGQESKLSLDEFKDAVCFVGITAVGTSDLDAVPLENNYPMVGLHANVFNSLITGRHIFRVSRLINIFLLIALLSIVYFINIKRKDHPVVGFVMLIGIGFLFFTLGCLLFVFAGVWINLFYPLSMMVLLYIGMRIYTFMQETRARELLEKELSIAKQIQESFLPEPMEKFKKLKIAAHMITAKHVGGDLYDMQILADNKLGILIGDVSGKGVAAALIMAKTMSLFRVLAFKAESPGQLLYELNEAMAKDIKPGMFVTATYIIYLADQKKALIASAGHSATHIFRKKDLVIENIKPSEGMPIGIMQGAEFSQEEVTLNSGDRIVLCTDGITEAKNLKRQEFEEERLCKLVLEHPDQEPQETISAIEKQVKVFAGKAPQHDDCTLIILKQEGA
ncbi:MAG: SpoIIE family protein phosphatase [Candidatus Omnitrophota bacterium]